MTWIAAAAVVLVGCADAEAPSVSSASSITSPAGLAREADDVESLLGRVERAYRNARRDAAAELAADAYVEHYELMEQAIEEKDPELNEELESLLGTELRSRIRSGAPTSEVSGLIDDARALLGDALEAVRA